MRPLKVSTEVTVRVGPFVDKTDGVTEEAGLAGAGTELSKAGAAFGSGPTLGTHDAEGYYPITLTTTHTNTVGELVVKVHDAATHLPVRAVFTVLPAVVFDSLVAGTDTLQVDAIQWLGTACATPTVAGVPEVDVTHWIGTAAATPTTAGVPEVDLTHIAGSAVSTSTAQLGVNVVQAAGTAWGSGAITAASIANGAIDAATFAAGAIDAAAIADAAIDFATFAADCKTGTGLKANVESISANAITATAINADAITADKVAANVHQETIELAFTYDATATYAAAQAGSLVKEIADNAGGSALTTGDIADAVWDEALSGHTSAGTAGKALADAGSAGDPWTTAVPGAYGSGTAGYIIGNSIPAILTDTAEIGAAGAGLTALASASGLSTVAGYLDTEVAAILAAVDTEVAAIKAKTDNLPASPAAVGSAMTLESGAITAAVVATGAIDADALATDAVTEIADGILNRDMSTGSDSGSATVRTPRQALRFLRNKWSVSGTTLTVTKEDDATASWTAEVTTDAAANPITASDPASS